VATAKSDRTGEGSKFFQISAVSCVIPLRRNTIWFRKTSRVQEWVILILQNRKFQLDYSSNCLQNRWNLKIFAHLNSLPVKTVKACDTVNLFEKVSFMKKLTLGKFLFVCAAVTFALVVGCWPQNSIAQTPPAPAITESSAPPVTPVVPPPSTVPGSPYAEVVRLTQAGVDQSIIETYVTNSTGLFNLDSDKIVYLSDLGAPNSLVTTMMQHDQQLQQQFAATQAAQPAQQTPPA
jgi:hypothetical protein